LVVLSMDLLLWRNDKKTKTKQVFDGLSRWDFAGGFLGPFSFFSHLFLALPCLSVWCWTFNYDRFERFHGVALYLRCAATLVVLLNTRNNVYKIELSADDKTKCPVFTRYLIVFAIFKLHSPQVKVHSIVHPLSTRTRADTVHVHVCLRSKVVVAKSRSRRLTFDGSEGSNDTESQDRM
jgi:hypothetical protein